MKAWALVFISLVSVCAVPAAQAHEVRPGYLELRQSGAETYDVLWKVPAKGDRRLALYVRLPDTCRETEPVSRFTGGAYIERWRATCEGGLAERNIAIDGLSGTRTDVLARVQRLDGTGQTVRLTPDSDAFTVTDSPGFVSVAKSYFGLGVEHILFGIDHLLFVLALLFLVRGWRRLIVTITAFTVAHSLTLAAATLGWVHVPTAPVEAAIALSIVFVAVEIIRGRQGRPGLAERKPWMIAFLFGLLHGFGFASALSETGLPETAIPLALLFFNLGVEAGQIAFVAAAVLAAWAVRSAGLSWPRRCEPIPVYAIGTIAMYWTIDRTMAMVAG